jgi:predicted permease
MVSRLPLSGGNQTGGLFIDGADRATQGPSVETRTASPDYFRTLAIPLHAGRTFTSADGADAPPVAIVDEALARLTWPGKSAIGQRVREGEGSPWSTVVGVVGHVHHTGLDNPSQPQVYWNHPQRVEERMALVVKTRGEPAALTRSIAAVVRGIDPEQPIYDARPLDEVVDRSLAARRFQTTLLGAFAAAALALASIGAYGVIAYGVGQRSREFGVRMALGARRRDVTALVLRRGGALVATGTAAGLALAVAAVRVLATLVFAVAPRDAASFALATAVLLAVSAAACWLPARRAARVEPSIALRND